MIEWKKPLGVKENPFAYRWMIDFKYFSFRVHKWLCSDDDRAYHSHPVNMISLIIWGSYVDHEMIYGLGEFGTATRKYKVGQVNWIPRDKRHWVEILERPTWTLMFTWGKARRWDFWDIKTLKRRRRDKYFIEEGNHVCK